MSKIPLNLQYFAEPAEPAATPATEPAAATPAKTATPEDIASAVIKAIGERTTRAETGVVRSMASEYGMTEEQLKAVLDKHKADQAKAIPDEAQKQIDEAKAELKKYKLAAEVAKEGAALGLLDADVAITLLDEAATKTNDKGEFTGLKAALDKLKETKPYLFGAAQKPGAMAQKVSGTAEPVGKTPQDEIREQMFKK